MNSQPIPILMYHKIAQAPASSTLRGHYVSPTRFRAHLRLLSLLGYRGLTLREAMERQHSGKAAVCTFDDGYTNFCTAAAPALEAAGMRGTVFMVSGQIGGNNAWDIAIGDTPEPLMSAGQLRAVNEAGHEVGSHTVNHIRLAEADDATGPKEIAESKEMLEGLVGPVTSFCYPYGSESERVVSWTQAAGYKWACSTRKGVNRPGDPSLLLKRINVRRETGAVLLAYKLLREARRA